MNDNSDTYKNIIYKLMDVLLLSSDWEYRVLTKNYTYKGILYKLGYYLLKIRRKGNNSIEVKEELIREVKKYVPLNWKILQKHIESWARDNLHRLEDMDNRRT